MNEALLLALPAGFFVGATLNIPVGPNGALAFFRASIYGWKSILPTALGALLASSIYIFVGALFVSNPTVSAISKSPIFHGLGGVLLMLLAVFLYKKSFTLGAVEGDTEAMPSDKSMFFSSLLVGMTNPKSIVGFPAALIASGYEFQGTNILLSSALVTVGGFLSSALWWVLFVLISKRFGPRDNSVVTAKITRGLSYLIGIFAVTRLFKIFA